MESIKKVDSQVLVAEAIKGVGTSQTNSQRKFNVTALMGNIDTIKGVSISSGCLKVNLTEGVDDKPGFTDLLLRVINSHHSEVIKESGKEILVVNLLKPY